jgi:hypothetical protein
MALQFSDTSNKKGLIQDCETKVFGGDYGAISNNSVYLDTFTRYLNEAYNDLVTIILESDGRWQFDDSTYTDLPIGTTDLVATQQDYTLDDAHIKITSVHVKDSDGNYQPVHPIDEWDIIKTNGTSPEEFFETDGMPQYYDKIGNMIFLYPAPASASVTTSAGLKVRFQRNPNYFTSSDTTKEPGVPDLFHNYLSLKASFEFALDQDMQTKAQTLQVRLQKKEEEIRYFYNTRDKDDKKTLTAKKVSFK